jgi:hypothetical protein
MSQPIRPAAILRLAIQLALLLTVAWGDSAFGQQPNLGFPMPVVGNAAQSLQPKNPGFLVRADVNRAGRSYREGDTLSITVAAETDAYVYVLYKQADGEVFQIFPNVNRPNNHLQARQAVEIPGPEDLFTWVVGAPFGKEYIKVLASREPLAGLSDPATRQKFFNPLSSGHLKGIQLELGKEERAWAEDSVEINTYQAQNQEQPASARRFGLFLGIGHYQYIFRWQKSAEGKETKIYEPGHRDARTMAGVLQEVGQLSDARIITNTEATRAKVEEAFTTWLPSVSRPGDTVIVFFSGMALPIAQAAGVEAQGTVLPLYDFMSPSTVAELRKQKSSGKLTADEKQQLARAEELIERAASQDAGSVAVVREWGLTNDRFAHWLQGLAGRQVVVLLDAPYASAFATAGGSTADQPLAGGVTRLRDLGQREIALLGACGQSVSNVQRDPQGLSLMTQLLVQSIQSAPAALSLEQAYREVAAKLETRLQEINRQGQASGKETVVYRPYLVNSGTQPVFLKP